MRLLRLRCALLVATLAASNLVIPANSQDSSPTSAGDGIEESTDPAPEPTPAVAEIDLSDDTPAETPSPVEEEEEEEPTPSPVEDTPALVEEESVDTPAPLEEEEDAPETPAPVVSERYRLAGRARQPLCVIGRTLHNSFADRCILHCATLTTLSAASVNCCT